MEFKYHIQRAHEGDASAIKKLAEQTFIESHGHSANEVDIKFYLNSKLTLDALHEELSNPKNLFHLLWDENKLLGYSKIILNSSYSKQIGTAHCKLERLYLLETSLGSGAGQLLFDFNMNLARQSKQESIWLYTWVENFRALSFYKKNGFTVIDTAEFEISPSHTNPNYILELQL